MHALIYHICTMQHLLSFFVFVTPVAIVKHAHILLCLAPARFMCAHKTPGKAIMTPFVSLYCDSFVYFLAAFELTQMTCAPIDGMKL